GSTSALDASATQLAGSYEPGVTLAQPGAIPGDSAAGFGPGGGVALPASGALDLRGAFSVEAWVRPSVAGQNGGIFEKTVGGAAASPLGGGGGPSYIGDLGQSLYPFQGTLDELAVFPQALSAERVRAHWVGGAAVHLAATVAGAGTLRTSVSVSAAEPDPDPASNTLTLVTMVTP